MCRFMCVRFCIEGLGGVKMYKSNEEYEKDRKSWLNSFHYNGTYSNIFSAKRLLEESRWAGLDEGSTSAKSCHCCGYKNPETKDLSVREWR